MQKDELMCGIIGYIGKGNAGAVILGALKRLEYRGYDSAGIAVLGDGGLEVKKEAGKLAEIEGRHDFAAMQGEIGIGHTRWATHGIPNDANAHPHADCKNEIVLVHNGIIENYAGLKEGLGKKGHVFRSETDSEVIAHLVEEEVAAGEGTKEAIRKALAQLEGSYALAILRKGERKIYAARKSSPLILGVGKGEMFCASDVPAVLEHTREVVYVHDGELVELTGEGYEIEETGSGKRVNRGAVKIEWTAEMARKDGYEHFMLKEIMEQHTSLRNTLNAEVKQAAEMLKRFESIMVVACGTSYHAGLIFKSALQRHLRKRCDAVLGSEFAYGALAVVDRETVVVAISQSGETADTLGAVREAKRKGAKIIGVTNVVGSSLSRESDATVYIAAGPEISVVATKTFTSQIAALLKLVFTAAGKNAELEEMRELADVIEKILSKREEVEELARKLVKEEHFFFIGRGNSYPVALEGALKLKEITYLHAEAYAGGELKHGPLSLLESGIPVIAIAPSDESLPKMRGNIRECKARKARIIAFSDDAEVLREADVAFAMPKVSAEFAPIVYIIPLQLLAYYIAVMQGKDPDKPRNLAKSVTVE